jgi:3-phenylpropionate/cinnamic acid dioxygenase small subunit
MMALQDTFKIQAVIARFASSFDLKDWDGLQSCFTESIYTDYGDLRGTPPETITAQDYVASRRVSLENLKTHHLSGNYEINHVDKLNAACRASMVVWRKSNDEEFTTHCVYIFKLVKVKSDWKISGITQKVLWNEGTPSIHKGAK